MAAMALAVLAIYLVVLFNTQLFTTRNIWPNPFRPSPAWKMWSLPGHHTDRSGRTLVTNQSTYSLTFDRLSFEAR